MGRLRRKRVHSNIKDIKKKFRLKRKTKDVDQIHEDMQPDRIEQYLHQKVDPDLPGCGQFYCLECAKYYVNEKSLIDHQKSKVHKRRLKQLKEGPYTQKEAEMAAGMGSYTVQTKKPNTRKSQRINDANMTEIDSVSDMIVSPEQENNIKETT